MNQAKALGQLVLALAIVALLCPARSMYGSVLQVDIGVADGATPGSPNQVQTGFSDFSVLPIFSTPDFTNIGVSTVSRVFGSVTVSIRGTANGPVFFDSASDVTGPLGDLAEDGVFVVQGDLFVTLSNLPGGIYHMTTYHHWVTPFGGTVLPFNIGVNTGGGESIVASAVPISTGTSPASLSTATFGFTATGADVVVRLIGGGTSPSALINPVLDGFTLTSVPEPSTWLLLALGMAAIGIRRLNARLGRSRTNC